MSPYETIARKAAKYTRAQLCYGASNVDNPGPMAHRVSEARAFMLNGVPRGFNLPFVLQYAAGAISAGAGNCSECAAVALSYLYRHQTLPLDMVSYTHHDHGWVVIGRPAGTNIRHPRTWGDNPIICDPWVGFGGNRMVSTMDEYMDDYDTNHVQSVFRVDQTISAEAPF